MRGELFEENEVIEDEYHDYEEKLNPLLSDNVFELQKQHMILLQYIVELESKSEIYKNEIKKLKRRLNLYERDSQGKPIILSEEEKELRETARLFDL